MQLRTRQRQALKPHPLQPPPPPPPPVHHSIVRGRPVRDAVIIAVRSLRNTDWEKCGSFVCGSTCKTEGATNHQRTAFDPFEVEGNNAAWWSFFLHFSLISFIIKRLMDLHCDHRYSHLAPESLSLQALCRTTPCRRYVGGQREPAASRKGFHHRTFIVLRRPINLEAVMLHWEPETTTSEGSRKIP